MANGLQLQKAHESLLQDAWFYFRLLWCFDVLGCLMVLRNYGQLIKFDAQNNAIKTPKLRSESIPLIVYKALVC